MSGFPSAMTRCYHNIPLDDYCIDCVEVDRRLVPVGPPATPPNWDFVLGKQKEGAEGVPRRS